MSLRLFTANRKNYCRYLPIWSPANNANTHLPCVPLPFLQRYASREPDDVHTQYLVMPSTIQRDEGVVVVWEMGKWTVHILNPKHLASSRMYEFPKQQPAQVNGEDWRDDPLL